MGKLLEPVVHPPRLAYSLAEFALATSLSDRSIRYLIEHKELKAKRVGGRWIISAEAARDFFRRDHPTHPKKTKKQKAAEAAAAQETVSP